MGLLDDAIREHLDLKRRRGADPAEVERAEREALGPVRRGPEEQESGEPGLEQGIAYDHEHEQDWGEPFEDEAGEPEAFVPEEPLIAVEQPTRQVPRGSAEQEDLEEPFEPDDPFADTRGARTPAPHPAPASPAPEQPSEYAGQETVEYEVEAGLQEEGEMDADDVLEETPEFLQDTPDHDRLWFEQRPPKDFDFDG
jgi:hypothetical protein